jgi:hypothetical protein
MAFLDFIFGKRAKTQQLPTINPQQQQLQSQLLQYLMQQLSQQQDLSPEDAERGFAPYENLARENFSQKTIPSLAERFTGMGSGGQRSSAFQSALGQAGSGLESNLAALRSQYGLQQQQMGTQRQSQLANLLGLGLSPRQENIYMSRQPGFLESTALPAASALGGGLGQQIGSFAGNRLFGGQH